MGDYENVKARASLKDYAEQHLERARSGGKYVCPVCGSGGSGEPGSDSAFSITADGNRWTCFGSCGGKGGDIFDLAGAVNGTEDKAEQLRIVAEWAGVQLEGKRGKFEVYDDFTVNFDGTEDKPRGFQATMNARKAQEETRAGAKESGAEGAKGEKATDTPEPDYAAGRERHRRYIAECAARLSDGYKAYLSDAPEDKAFTAVADYLEMRGIGLDEACALGIGYDPKPAHGWQDEAGAWHRTPRLVLPWLGSDYYHIDRAIDGRAGNLKYDKPSKGEVGAQPLYNPEAFAQDYVIAVEGVLDAIVLQLCGFNAIALGGTTVNDLANEAAARNYAGTVIDMLDADGDASDARNGKGRRAGKELCSLLGEAGITVLDRAEYGVAENTRYGQLGEVSEGYKDAGEWYAADPQYLKDFMRWAVEKAREKAKRAKEADYREAMRHLNVKDPASVARDVLELRDVYEPVPTGIASLDNALGGGVSLGETTFFGAVSSYGKTTLAVQIADHMAAAGRSVLFVTIEQSAKELVSKSLSRLVYTENVTGWNVATPNEITSLRARRAWGAGQNEALSKAVEDYERTIAPHIRILEGNKQPTVADVRAVAAVMAEHDGQAPIVFIDYLQLLAPLSERYDTDKRNADMNVSELRKMARDLKTHVWCISSLNRSSYSGVISLDSFKESGGIEYGADNLLGLQPRDMAANLEGVADSKMKREADKLIRENKKKAERDCELVVLKQRNGALPDEPLPLTFKPMAAYFMEPATASGRAAHRAQARTVL